MDDATESELEPNPPADAVEVADTTDDVDGADDADTERCANCHTPLAGPFCHQCGQEDRDMDRPFVGLLREWLGGVLSFDARLWRTLGPLMFRPGLLTTEYLAGRRARFVPPLRLYLFASIAMFLAIGWSGYSMVRGSADGKPEGESAAPVAFWIESDDEGQAEADGGAAGPDDEGVVEGADLAADDGGDPGSEDGADGAGAAPAAGPGSTEDPAPGAPRETADGDGAADEGLEAMPFFAKLEYLAEEDPDALNRVYRERLAQALILLTVVFAGILWVLFRRSDRYFAHHLIFATHLHAAGFVALSVATLLGIVLRKVELIGEENPITPFVVLAVPFYMFVALRRVHRESRWATLVKLILTLGAYLIALVFTLFATVLVAVALL